MLNHVSAPSPSLRLPLQYIFVSLFCLALSQILMFEAGPHLLKGDYRVPSMWAVSHLLIIGWSCMVAMGAMYQLVPVAFLTPIYSERIGYIQFHLMTLSIVGFVLAFWLLDRTLLLIFGTGLVSGFLLFIFNMLASFRAIKSWTMISKTVFASIIYLSLTILIGGLLLLQLTLEIFPPDWHNSLLYSHITFGIVGWFSLLIFGFSYKMVPMFALAHHFSMSKSLNTYYLFHAGILTIVLSYWLENLWLLALGSVFILLAFTYFLLVVIEILRKRMKLLLDEGFVFSLISIPVGFIIHLAFVLTIFFEISYSTKIILTNWIIFLIYLYFMLWITLCIAGYLYKIIPFLWWTHKYSQLAGKQKVPMLKDFVNKKMTISVLVGFIISTLGVALSILLSNFSLFFLSQLCLTLIISLFIYSLLMIFKK